LDIILKEGSVIAETLLNENAADALKEKASSGAFSIEYDD